MYLDAIQRLPLGLVYLEITQQADLPEFILRTVNAQAKIRGILRIRGLSGALRILLGQYIPVVYLLEPLRPLLPT